MYRLQKAGHKQARPLDEKAAPAARPHGSLLDDLVDEDEVFERTVLKEHLEPKPAAAVAEPAPAEKPTRPASPSNSLAATLPGLKYIDRIGVDEVLGWLRAGIVWIVLAIILCVAAALAYAYMTPPRYTAYTDIVVNPSNLNVVNDGVFSPNQQRDTQILEVESKLRTVTSRNVLARVVDELKLDEDPEFISPPPLARLKAFFSPKPEDGDNKVGALRSLGERVAAERDPRSFVVTLAVWTNDPDKSVTVSKAMVKAFESELFQTTSDSSLRIVDDLKKRLEEMRQNVTVAEKRVADFRRENGLQENNGQLVSNLASGELNAQVLAAQQRVIQEESRLKQMQAAIAQNRTQSDAIFDSQTMNTIRAQYSTLQQQIGAMTLTYGARHPRLATAGAERDMLERGIADEAQRILLAAKTNVAEARSSLDALRLKAVAERANVFTDNEAQVRLRDLERDANSAAAIYETYLNRSRQIAEQQTIDSTNVRVISQPVAPNSRSWPPGKLIFLIAGGVGGLFLGLGIAIALGLLGFLRRTDHAERYA
ncbi:MULTISPECIES: polysaccharide biosynthesis protein UppM [Rhizobium/Agrobacterium group]|uniref:polysaccharide biosynthesis protein UppM n=1 Tax=Rhizobium/Agrobacterium group TaxID=227290 RepID=UPI0003F200DA|nr:MULTISPECIES: polysaccharide biosynthesis protein UppM [Rhizobium/Agrobacterium group]AHK02196.1 succinoglycan biosynthesis transport protein [Agrobacterium tumefaciens LBA4213 (Ach5)]AKC08020.1 succinoglycan biosynthesis transport protein [Agrobacterium tumefaciens]AYM16860.1 succinoglycan biosynthesis transport protein [Agrobacterium tumefaciens]AYM68161.1 succinoglycan biosynthesis transport protein [Agrobacterium tumefaciens]NIB59659.1 GumC family protein [Agrobacterium tumefaciens]